MAISYTDAVLEQVPASNTTVYTTPTVNSAHIISAVIHNESGTNATIQVNIVQTSGSVDVTNRYVNRTVSAGSTLVLRELHAMVLNTGDFISAIAGTASALNLKIGIKEITT